MYVVSYFGAYEASNQEFVWAIEFVRDCIRSRWFTDRGGIQVTNIDLDSGDGLHGLTDDERDALLEVLS